MCALYKCRFIFLMKGAFNRYGGNEIPKILKTRLNFSPFLSLAIIHNPSYLIFFPFFSLTIEGQNKTQISLAEELVISLHFFSS